ncbi:uncharacterized protein LOC142764915 [Rhipicephalus microplus]|uniref:uncharacterized protein LOC142764915 n=1 Tax=Rhipicephalus microplus TaxID=6941 RepID=UPI002376B092
MRKKVFILLPLLLGPVLGGNQQPKQKELKGCGPKDRATADKRGPFSCVFFACQRNCGGLRIHWYFNWFYKACFLSDNSHCGVGENFFDTCDACMKKCKGAPCVEKVTTTQEPHYDLWENG